MFDFWARVARRRFAVLLFGCLPGIALAQSVPLHPGAAAKTPPAVPKGLLAPLPVEVNRAENQFTKAVNLQRAEKVPEAIAAYDEYLRMVTMFRMSSRAEVPAHLNLAQLYHLQGDFKDEETHLVRALAIDPNNATALAEMAAVDAAAHHLADATLMARRALALHPPAVLAAPAHFALASVALQRNDLATAEKEFGISVQLTPENPEANYNYALVLGKRQKYKQALVAIERVIERAPKMAQAQYYRAYLKQQLRDSFGALGVYNDMLRSDPKNVMALSNRALVYQEIGQTQNAISGFLDVLTLQPNNLVAQKNVARLYYTIHNYPAAKAHYASAYALAPNDGDVLAGLGLSELQEGAGVVDPNRRAAAFKLAEQHLKAFLALDPNNQSARDALAFFYERVGNFADALTLYRKQLAQTPDNLDLYYNIARVYTMQRNIDGIVEIWKQYRTRKPEDPVSYIQTARILEAGGKYEQALAEWRLLLAKRPNDGNIHVAIAQDLTQVHQPDEARKEYQVVLSPEVTGNILASPKSPSQNLAAARALRMDAFHGLAQLARTAKNPTEELQWLQQAQQLALDQATKTGTRPDASAFRDIAHAYELNQQPDLAEKEYLAWVQALPRDPEPFDHLAALYDGQNNVVAADGAYRRASVLSKDPAASLVQLAEMYHRRKMLDQAIAEYENLETRFPKETRFYSPLAQIYEQDGKDLKALLTWEALLRTDPTAHWAEDHRISVLVRLKRYEEALMAYLVQLDKNPQNAQTYADIAHVYALQGKSGDFLPLLQSRFEKVPNNRVLMNAILVEYQRKNQEPAGWTYLHSVVEKNKTEPGLLESLAAVYLQHQRTAEALDIYREVVALYPNDLGKKATLAQQLYANGNPAEALSMYEGLVARSDVTEKQRLAYRRQLIAWYEQQHNDLEGIFHSRELLKVVPKDYGVTVGLARMLADTKGVSEAKNEAEAVTLLLGLSYDPNYPLPVRAQLLNQVADIYEKQGRKTDAIAQYREVLKLDPQNAFATEALKRLAGS